MANIMRREPSAVARRGDPFSELRQMQRDMERMFSQFFGGTTPVMEAAGGEWTPLVESYVKDDNLVLKCELPGVDPKDVDVSFDQSAREMVIRGERKPDAKFEDYLYRELPYGRFERRFALPAGINVDQMRAKYINGMLEVVVPKAAEARPRKIRIETIPVEAETGVKKAA